MDVLVKNIKIGIRCVIIDECRKRNIDPDNIEYNLDLKITVPVSDNINKEEIKTNGT